MSSARRRDLAAAASSLLLHAAAVAAVTIAAATEASSNARFSTTGSINSATPVIAHQAGDPTPAEHEVSAPRRARLRRAVASGQLGLGQAFIELEAAESGNRQQARRASAAYAALLNAVHRRLFGQKQSPSAAVTTELARRGLHRHKSSNQRLSDALLDGGGNCVARTRLITALLHDAGLGHRVGARIFANHIAPVLKRAQGEYRFGMVHACTGLGVPVPALSLLDAELPQAADRCRDRRPIYGAGLDPTDPPPSWSGKEPPPEKHCPLPLWPWNVAGTEIHLSVRGGSAPQWRGQPALRLEITAQNLHDYSNGVMCHRRWLAIQREARDNPAVAAPFWAKAIGYYNESALAFAAGGELGIARELEAEVSSLTAEAQALLSSPAWEDAEVRHEHWSLIYLGASGQQLALRLAATGESWFASNLLAVLIREDATRSRALEIFATRTQPQQVEIAERAHWAEAGFELALARSRIGRRVLDLRDAIRHTRAAWELRACTFKDLERSARDSIQHFGIPPEYAPAIVTAVAEPSVVVDLDRRGCHALEFLAERERWLRRQSAEIRGFVARRTVAEQPL